MCTSNLIFTKIVAHLVLFLFTTQSNCPDYITRKCKQFEKLYKKVLRQPGIEPGAQQWECWILPLNHWRSEFPSFFQKRHYVNKFYLRSLLTYPTKNGDLRRSGWILFFLRVFCLHYRISLYLFQPTYKYKYKYLLFLLF